ncbi:hypothetical protein CA51_27070 [Rosistilla oblonga]|uniref:hypothetical protein n=1 Tax=Rosistilla oblonga TaxID=2527990 RepID=UPI00118AC041|nr:hypothetical protein [Rosistilla oblonga]QDV12821.1 hypothetical protein CA51_27070 [Rosistilla oblonga]
MQPSGEVGRFEVDDQPSPPADRYRSPSHALTQMAHKFTLNPESLKRQFAVYVVVAKGDDDTKLYVGKTGDNREGCNPVVSRCGNHFSYNKIHSQVRNKIPDHEHREYTYVFDHFDEYCEDIDLRREAIDRINEMERWLNEEIQRLIDGAGDIELLNPFSGKGYVRKSERIKRSAFRTQESQRTITGIVTIVRREIGRTKR